MERKDEATMAQHKILVVDDEKSMIQFLSALLRRESYDVMTAGSGAEALEIVRERAPDVMITDVKMPEMDGIRLLEEAKKMKQAGVKADQLYAKMVEKNYKAGDAAQPDEAHGLASATFTRSPSRRAGPSSGRRSLSERSSPSVTITSPSARSFSSAIVRL